MPNKSRLTLRASDLLSHWCLQALLVLSALGYSGCSTTSAMRYSPTAVASLSPSAQLVQPFDALRMGKDYVAAHPGTEFLVGSGDSMRPLYPDHTVVVLQPVPFTDLRPGMTAVYSTDLGRTIAHVLVKKVSDGWVAMGVGNPECDSTLVTADNLQGVVVKAFTPTESPMVALLDEARQSALVASMR
jgi:hypothetical protein